MASHLFCPRCRERITANWSFCPRCGARLPSGEESQPPAYNTSFTEMFKEIERQMKEALGPQVTGNIEFFDLKPEFVNKNPLFKSGGFRVKITRNGDGPPRVDIKAFGDADEKLAEKMTEAIRAQNEAAVRQEAPEEVEEEGISRDVSQYREPAATTRWAGDHLIVDLELPGVESEEDIEVKKLEESIEVKAFAGDSGYFKILSVPKGAKLLDRNLKDCRLTMKIG